MNADNIMNADNNIMNEDNIVNEDINTINALLIIDENQELNKDKHLKT
jgi:hypothetical protein